MRWSAYDTHVSTFYEAGATGGDVTCRVGLLSCTLISSRHVRLEEQFRRAFPSEEYLTPFSVFTNSFARIFLRPRQFFRDKDASFPTFLGGHKGFARSDSRLSCMTFEVVLPSVSGGRKLPLSSILQSSAFGLTGLRVRGVARKAKF
ncbi:hypothetical protein NL676_035617 [Syzygium grande]|nr:hypothetical protein NL676_035617 [Syzygium grande]